MPISGQKVSETIPKPSASTMCLNLFQLSKLSPLNYPERQIYFAKTPDAVPKHFK